MDERYTQYIENLRRVRALARPEAHAGMKAADLLEEIKQNAAESYTLMQQSDAILDEVIFSRRAEDLTEEEAAGLSEFAGKLFNYANSEDLSRPPETGRPGHHPGAVLGRRDHALHECPGR